MEEKEIYIKVLNKLYEGLKTEKHSKYKNDRLSDKQFVVNNLYPDIIMTKKNSDEIEFIVDIVVKSHISIDVLNKRWKPLSKTGANFYLLVPKSEKNRVESMCNEERLKFRIGTYSIKQDEVELKFY